MQQGQRKRQEDQQNPTVQTLGSSQRELRQLMLALLEKGFQCPAPPPFSEDVIEMRAALRLITRQAFQTGEVLALQWADIDPQRGTILRRRTETHLTPEVLQSLQEVASGRGGWLFAQGYVMTIRTDAEFRQALWRACKRANVDYVPPSHLRQAALRDYGSELNYLDAGFISPKAYAEALAQDVLDKNR